MLLSVMGITLEEIEINAALPINPTIIRIMRVLRIARGKWETGQGRDKQVWEGDSLLSVGEHVGVGWET